MEEPKHPYKVSRAYSDVVLSVGIRTVKGELVHAVSEMNIADNHLKFWNKLVEVANDPWVYSSFRTPSLVFTDVVVAGI